MQQNSAYIAALFSSSETIGIKQIREGKCPLNIDINTAQNYIDKNDIKCAIEGEPMYHQKLYTIPSKPYLLYMQGNTDLLNKKILGVVGPRRMSVYAEKVLRTLFTQVAAYELVTISGGAEGSDTTAHSLSMQYNIPTIVVLGGGLGYYYESGKREFLQKVIKNGGLIISEYPLWFSPKPYTFPQRNRIIAGLSDVLFLPEAGEKSGSLITVDYAIKKGVPIYAPMQDIFHTASKGTNTYISLGKITPLCEVDSFLDKYFNKKYVEGIDDEQMRVLETGSERYVPLLAGDHASVEEQLAHDMERQLFG